MEQQNNQAEMRPTVRKKKKKTETRYDRMLNKLKNHPIFSIIMIGSLFISVVMPLYLFFQSQPVKQIIDKVKIPGTQERLLKVVKNYYKDLEQGTFTAKTYFAPQVDRYYNYKGMNPARIDISYSIDRKEFVSPHSEILDSTVAYTDEPTGERVLLFWGKYSCYRTSKKQYESCRVHEQFIFDKNNKIRSLVELELKDLSFSFHDPKGSTNAIR